MNTVIISGVMPSCIEEVSKAVAKYEKVGFFRVFCCRLLKYNYTS